MVGIGVGRSSKTVGWECLADTNSQHDNNELFAICDDGMFMSRLWLRGFLAIVDKLDHGNKEVSTSNC